MIKENETNIEFTETYITNREHYFPMLNIRIGRNVKIGKGTKIFENTIVRKNVTIGEGNIIGNSCLIRENVVIGNNNKIGFSCSLEPHLIMGDNNSTQGFCMLSEYSVIKNKNFFPPHFNNPADNSIGKPKGEYIARPAIIGSRCRFGSGTRLVPEIVIADGTITGAMSLVTKDTEPNSLYYGVPAKKIREIKEGDELR